VTGPGERARSRSTDTGPARGAPRGRGSGHRPEQGVTSATPRRSADPRRAPLSAHDLLTLQALAGNRAVTGITLVGTPAVQRRRVPEAAHADPLLAPGATDSGAHRQGMDVVIARALSELTSAQQTAVRTAAVTSAGGAAAWAALDAAGRARLLGSALRTAHPTLVLGDPALIDTGPRPGTLDAANIGLLVTQAAAAMGALVAGTRDPDLAAIFGPSRVATVKTRYSAAMTRMNLLHATGRIVTDRSGYNAEVSLGGFTNPEQISLSPDTIDTPGSKESVVTLVHESMHAGVPSVDDRGYIGSPSFTTLDEPDKLDNAAHYEIAVRRIWGMPHAYPGVVFVPAGASRVVGGVTHTAPRLTPMERAARRASETVRAAWAMGLNMHSLWVQVNLHRAEWTGLSLPATFTGATSPRFANCLPFWSKVEGLTVHQRPGISAAGAGPDTAPVTQVDVALSEGLLRLLGQTMDVASARLDTPAHTAAFLASTTTAAERSAATTVVKKTTLVLTALRRSVGQMTGSEARDLRVVRRMAAAPDFAQMLVTRSPATFS
jgi:hypothetical protein